MGFLASDRLGRGTFFSFFYHISKLGEKCTYTFYQIIVKLIFPLFSFILPFPPFVKFFPHNFLGHIFWAPQALQRPRKSTFRLKALGSGSRLRVLLVLIDQKDPHHALKKLMRIRLATFLLFFITSSWTFHKSTIKNHKYGFKVDRKAANSKL